MRAIVKKLKGCEVEILEEDECTIIKPIEDPIAKAFGLFKGGNLSTEKFLMQKKVDKELEYE